MKLLSIDPGQNTGLAEYRDGQLVGLETVTPYGLVVHLHCLVETYDLIAIEDSRCQSALFSVEGEKVQAKALKIARDVGRIDALCAMVAEICAKRGVAIVQVSPKTKGEKLNAAKFKAVTGWGKPCNQHERDAAMVGWLFRHSRVESFYRKQGDVMQEFTARSGKRVKKQGVANNI